MANSEMMTLKLSRYDMCNIKRALTTIIFEFKDEVSNQEITEDRRQVAKSSMEMWRSLKTKVDTQFAKQDK